MHILKQSKCKITTAEVIGPLFYMEANWAIKVGGLLFNWFYFAFILFRLSYCLIDVNYTCNSLVYATTKKIRLDILTATGLRRTHQRGVYLLRNSYAGLNLWMFLSNSCVTISWPSDASTNVVFPIYLKAVYTSVKSEIIALPLIAPQLTFSSLSILVWFLAFWWNRHYLFLA